MDSLTPEEQEPYYLYCFLNRLVRRLVDLHPKEYLDVTQLNLSTMSGSHIRTLPTRGRYTHLAKLFRRNRLRLYSPDPEKYYWAFLSLPLLIQRIHRKEVNKTVKILKEMQKKVKLQEELMAPVSKPSLDSLSTSTSSTGEPASPTEGTNLSEYPPLLELLDMDLETELTQSEWFFEGSVPETLN